MAKFGPVHKPESTEGGRRVKTYQHRVFNQSWLHIPARRDHEAGVEVFIGASREAGKQAAAGWRNYEEMGAQGAVSSDAVVFLEDSIFGLGWVYLEYELSARGPKRVAKKLKNYLATSRSDNRPLLVVCWNDNAEKNFQQAGWEANLPMLTTTLDRLKKHGPFGSFDCWSLYGHRVRIG